MRHLNKPERKESTTVYKETNGAKSANKGETATFASMLVTGKHHCLNTTDNHFYLKHIRYEYINAATS